MPITCAGCGTENPDQARFCLACGSPVGTGRLRRERKFVAMVFADLVGSTSLGEQEDPEVVQNLVSRTFSRLGREIERFGGTVDKIMGDAILALFGVPAAHEDDSERAVRAALAMQAVLAELNQRAPDEGGPQLGMRIGVEAGEVMVNLERSPDLPDRMVTGDAANTAARIQSIAEPGTVVVGPGVHASTDGTIDYRELPPVALKGKADALPVWVALAVGGHGGERQPLGLEAALVGREEELDTLRRSFRRVVSQGRPALVTLIGGAGVGKSRLAAELRSYVEGRPDAPAWMRGRSLAYGNASYSAIREAIRDRCGIHEDDGPPMIRAKVDDAVAELGAPEIGEGVGALVGLTSERAFSREELFETWRRFLERVAASRPLVLVMEDVHWADEGLLDFIDHLADWAEGPILILAIARPELLEIRSGWGGGKRSYAAIPLDPLTDEQNGALLAGLLGGPVPEELRSMVVERSEGNPLFTEELVRALIDRGVLRPHEGSPWEIVEPLDRVSLPRSVQGVIAARLDGLPPEEKEALLDASVIGRVFWLGALAALRRMDRHEVRPSLDRLRLKELVTRREPSAFAADVEFRFRHVLIRDVAYGSLPKAARATKHSQVAGWLVTVAGERADEFAESIATHHAQARGYLRGLGVSGPELDATEIATLRWARAAGDRAERVKDLSEAARWYALAAEVAQGVGAPKGEQAAIQERLGDISFPAGLLPGAQEAYQRAIDLREADGTQGDIGRLEAKLTFAAWYTGRTEGLMETIERSVARLEPLGDGPDLAFALVVHGASKAFVRREDGVPELRRGVEMARATGDRVTLAQGSVLLGLALALTGRSAEGIPILEEAEELSREVGDAESQLMAFGLLADALNGFSEVPQPDRVDALIREAADLGRKGKRDLRLERTLDSVAWFSFQRGRLDEADEALDEQLEIARRNGLPFVGPIVLMQAWVRLVRGDVDGAHRLVAQASEGAAFESIRKPIVEGVLARALGQHERAVSILVGTAADAAVVTTFEGGAEFEHLLLEAIRAALDAGRRPDADASIERLRGLAKDRALSRPFLRCAEGLVADDPRSAATALGEAAVGFAERRQPIDEGRCLIDLARVRAAAGVDPIPILETAREILDGCGAGLYVTEADALRAEVAAARPDVGP